MTESADQIMHVALKMHIVSLHLPTMKQPESFLSQLILHSPISLPVLDFLLCRPCLPLQHTPPLCPDISVICYI